MFSSFLFALRAAGLKVSLTEWLALIEALAKGHARAHLGIFYSLGRSVLVKRESQLDLYDQVFAAVFHGVPMSYDLTDELLRWLEKPILPRELTPEERAMLEQWSLDKLRDELAKRLAEQKGRHDGGSKWIGTGGTSPFGYGGTNPAGIRIGGPGGGRSAVQIAESRRFQNLRSDRILDTRQMGAALRRLRRLARTDGPEELDLERSIDKSAREGGEIELVFAPPKANRLKLLLLMDVGGSMDVHTALVERLFSAAHAAKHFRAFRPYFFHNCVYARLYTDVFHWRGVPTDQVLKSLDSTWALVMVGDAWMSPYELLEPGGAISFYEHNTTTGLDWLRRLRERVPRSVWLNPEPARVWEADSIRLVRSVFPMFELTLDGLGLAVDTLRGVRAGR